MQFAPAVHPTLIRLTGELDDGSGVIAAIWRDCRKRFGAGGDTTNAGRS